MKKAYLTAKQFSKVYDRVKKCIPYKVNNPALGAVTLRFSEEKLNMIYTDLDSYLQVDLPCPGFHITGCLYQEVSVNAKALQTLAKDAKNEIDLSIEEKDGEKSLSVVIDGNEINLKSFDAFEVAWPFNAPWVQTHSADLYSFSSALDYALLAMSTDETRPHIRNVHIDGRNMVSTDGHRLHVAKFDGYTCPTVLTSALKRNGYGDLVEPNNALTINGTPAIWLSNALPKRGETIQVFDFTEKEIEKHNGKEVEVIGSRLVKITGDDFILIGKQSDSEFPPYDQVIPGHSKINSSRAAADNEVSFSKSEAKKVFERAKKLASDRTCGMKLTMNKTENKIYVSTSSEDFGSTVQKFRADYHATLSDTFEIGFNGCYLLDAISDFENFVCVRFGGKLDPVVVVNSDTTRLAVVMPMRI